MMFSSRKSLIGVGILAAAAVLFFVSMPRRERIEAGEGTIMPSSSLAWASPEATAVPPDSSVSSSEPVNPLTSEPCNNALRRPIAVMLSGDAEARPLSGITEADMVFEMPVITGSITRFMAVFICRDPIEIGSVRSARHNFISLAKSLDAIYAHWGGSHFALDLLKQHAIDNIDALPNPVGTYWRKDDIPAPHNGFTSMTRLLKAARFLQYRLEGHAPSYPHLEGPAGAPAGKGILEVGYPGPFRVRYVYDPSENFYTRIRGSINEVDKNSQEPVKVRNIVVMRAESRQIEGQYNDVAVEGKGDAVVYRGGQELPGTWKKDKSDPSGKLAFLDKNGEEIPFLPGNIWVEIVEPYANVSWTTE